MTIPASVETVIEQFLAEQGMSADARERLRDVIRNNARHAAAAECERIRQLAIDHHAHYDCDPHYGQPFADLLRGSIFQ